MKKYIYILTDCNRKCLQVGFTDNLLKTVDFYKETCAMFFDSNSHASRLVYFEEFTSEELATERFNQLLIFTRPQKERLIRAINTNWVDLSLNLKASQRNLRSILKDTRLSPVSFRC